MKSFVVVALLGAAAATACAPSDCCASECEYGSGDVYRIQQLNRQVSLPQGGGIGTLVTQAAGAETQIGAQKIVVPDKQTVTDQAKVSKTCSQTKKQDQGCAVSKRSFCVKGGIKIVQKGENSNKMEASASECGEEASQSKRSESVCSNCAPNSLPGTEGTVDFDKQCDVGPSCYNKCY